MSIISKIPEAITMIRKLERLIDTFSHVLSQAPLQLYGAGIVFGPFNSILRKSLEEQALGDIKVLTQVSDDWNACIQTLEGHLDRVISVVFSPDGSRVASGSNDNTVRVWDVQTGQCQHTLEGHSGWINSVVFSRDGPRVVSGSDDKTVRVWDVVSSTEILCYDAGIPRQDIQFSEDGSLVYATAAYCPYHHRHHHPALPQERPGYLPVYQAVG